MYTSLFHKNSLDLIAHLHKFNANKLVKLSLLDWFYSKNKATESHLREEEIIEKYRKSLANYLVEDLRKPRAPQRGVLRARQSPAPINHLRRIHAVAGA